MTGTQSLSGLRVLVVEDEMLVSLLIEDMLSDYGCKIVGPLASLGQALIAAHDETIDFALLDVNVAGERIYPVAEILSRRNIPFLLLSGYGRGALPPDRQHWRVCSKPFRAEDLIATMVEQVLARRVPRS